MQPHSGCGVILGIKRKTSFRSSNLEVKIGQLCDSGNPEGVSFARPAKRGRKLKEFEEDEEAFTNINKLWRTTPDYHTCFRPRYTIVDGIVDVAEDEESIAYAHGWGPGDWCDEW